MQQSPPGTICTPVSYTPYIILLGQEISPGTMCTPILYTPYIILLGQQSPPGDREVLHQLDNAMCPPYQTPTYYDVQFSRIPTWCIRMTLTHRCLIVISREVSCQTMLYTDVPMCTNLKQWAPTCTLICVKCKSWMITVQQWVGDRLRTPMNQWSSWCPMNQHMRKYSKVCQQCARMSTSVQQWQSTGCPDNLHQYQ